MPKDFQSPSSQQMIARSPQATMSHSGRVRGYSGALLVTPGVLTPGVLTSEIVTSGAAIPEALTPEVSKLRALKLRASRPKAVIRNALSTRETFARASEMFVIANAVDMPTHSSATEKPWVVYPELKPTPGMVGGLHGALSFAFQDWVAVATVEGALHLPLSVGYWEMLFDARAHTPAVVFGQPYEHHYQNIQDLDFEHRHLKHQNLNHQRQRPVYSPHPLVTTALLGMQAALYHRSLLTHLETFLQHAQCCLYDGYIYNANKFELEAQWLQWLHSRELIAWVAPPPDVQAHMNLSAGHTTTHHHSEACYTSGQ